MRHRRSFGVRIAVAACALGALTTVGTAATASGTVGTGPGAVGRSAAATSVPVTTSTAVLRCPLDYVQTDPTGHGRVVHVPATVARPIGLPLPAGSSLWGTATSVELSQHPAHRHNFTLAGPTRFACSGQANGMDEDSFATLTDPRHRTHQISAVYGMGQEGFAAGCTYLAAAHRPKAAKAWAAMTGSSLAECRRFTDDAPKSVTQLAGVRLADRASAPFAVVIEAPRGAELIDSSFTASGKPGPIAHTTTPTVSVAVMQWTSKHAYHFPMAQDCSLPAGRRSTCVASAAIFVDETLQSVYGWSARSAARAGRKVAAAFAG